MKGKTGIVGIVLVVIIAAVLFIFKGLGFGNGDGNGEGEVTKNNDEISYDVSRETETSVPESTQEAVTENVGYAVVKVNESKYYFNTEIYEMSEIDKLINDIKADETISAVKVIDDNASLAAYEAFTDALKENDLRYIQLEAEKENE